MASKKDQRRRTKSSAPVEEDEPRPVHHHGAPRHGRHRHRRSAGGRTAAQYDADVAGTRVMLKISRAMFARLLFVVHSMLTVWQAVDVYENTAYWGFALISVAIVIEGAYTIIVRAGDERRWFCPSVMLYIVGTAPPIWALETDMSSRRYTAWTKNGTVKAQEHELGTLKISHELWVQLVEQFLLVILIVARWFLPKGEITREQLSQILLAYLAIASDIVELFDVFKEPAVVKNRHLQNLVLGIWSISLLQFPFVLTVSRARKMRVAVTQSSSYEDIKRIHYRTTLHGTSKFFQICHDIDIWAILLANCFQDVPFLMTRVYLMVGYGTMTYTMIFFTCKNLLIIMLQSYRLFILVYDRYVRPTPEDDARQLVEHYEDMLEHCNEALLHLKGDRLSNEDEESGGAPDSGSGSTANAAAAPLLTAPDPPAGYKKRSPKASPAPSSHSRERRYKRSDANEYDSGGEPDTASASGIPGDGRRRSPRDAPRTRKGHVYHGPKGSASPRKRSEAGPPPRKRSNGTSPRTRASSDSRSRKRSTAESPRRRKATREKPIWEEGEDGYHHGRGRYD